VAIEPAAAEQVGEADATARPGWREARIEAVDVDHAVDRLVRAAKPLVRSLLAAIVDDSPVQEHRTSVAGPAGWSDAS